MTMKLWVPTQRDDEPRLPITPAVLKKLTDLGLDVHIQTGAGIRSGSTDEALKDAGASIVDNENAERLWGEAGLILTIQPPDDEHIKLIKKDAVLVGMLAPLKHPDRVRQLADKGVTSFSMEFVPRISRAQSMDVLSSQASIGGYEAVVLAAAACPKVFPMMMTAAGTITPARVLVLGAGVAGLQAIATAKRLGAVVEANDVRPAVKEQVESLGGRFIALPELMKDGETAGGYAKELTDEQKQQQQALIAKHIIGADVVIATAALFGKAPPLLITKDVIARKQPGGVIVDMAADPDYGHGNCELTQPGETITTDNGVTVIGRLNLPGIAATHASQVFANNMLAFLREFVAEGKVQLTLDDEIQSGAIITHGGEIVNAMVAKACGETEENSEEEAEQAEETERQRDEETE